MSKNYYREITSIDNLYKTAVQLKYFFVLFFVFGRKINCFFGRFYFSAENGKSVFGRSLMSYSCGVMWSVQYFKAIVIGLIIVIVRTK